MSVSLTKKGFVALTVIVSMCSREPVLAMYNRFGGMFQDGLNKTPHGNPIYRWSVSGGNAVEALTVFSANCLEKARVALLALPLAMEMRDNSKRRVLSYEQKVQRLDTVKQIHALNKPTSIRRPITKEAEESYLRIKAVGGGKAVIVSGVPFKSMSEVARHIGVTIGAVHHGIKYGHSVKGHTIKRAA